jgi:aminocarboxymuconate-semialdehyde decarboxylase
MDDAGVQVQVLSARPLPVITDEALAVKLIQQINDAHAALAERHPDRFLAYIELPLPYLDASIREYERCRDRLGLEAVNILAAHGTTSAVDPQFDPLFARLDEAGAVAFFHPRVNGVCTPLVMEHGLTANMGPGIEDAVLGGQMVMRRFPQTFPNLRIVIPHLGGMLPVYLSRLDNQMWRALGNPAEKPSATIRRIWYDTVAHSSGIALRASVEGFGADRIVTGSDYPALEDFDGYAASINYVRDVGLADDVVEQILHVNAPKLFGLIQE